MQKILLGSIVSMVIACNANKGEQPAQVVDKQKIKEEIQAKEDEFASVYNGNEIKNIGYYDDSAITFFPNRAPLVGRIAIINFLTSDLTSNSDRLSFETNDVFVSADGNQVVEIGHFKLVDSVNAIINSGNYMSLFEKKNGKYVCLRDMSASELPLNK